MQPKLHKLDDNPELKLEYDTWRDSRADFNDRLASKEEKAMKDRWQRHYMKGQTVSGDKAEDHRTKRRLKPPIDG